MQTQQIATAPTDQLPVRLSACHCWVSVRVLQAFFLPLYAAAGSPARLLCSYTCFAQVKMTPSSSQREDGASPLPLLCCSCLISLWCERALLHILNTLTTVLWILQQPLA